MAGVRCGNFERSAADLAAWLADEVLCPDCGAPTATLVRGTDLYPRMKIRAHRAPEGVTPGSYAAHPKGAVVATEAEVASVPAPVSSASDSTQWPSAHSPQPCGYCGKVYKSVQGMIGHLRECPKSGTEAL